MATRNTASADEVTQCGSAQQYDADWHHHNGLLARLPRNVCDRLRPELQLIALTPGMVLYRHEAPTQVYFLRSGVVSLLHVLRNGDTGEVAIVGNEGVVGVSLMFDSTSSPTRAVVQSPGEALVLQATTMAAEFQRGGEFQLLVLRYTQALMAQMAQVTLCTRRHRVEQQVCRWLLFAFDRAFNGELRVTHETVAEALGVRREGITEALGRLRERGGISSKRGHIRMLDHSILEAGSCECYAALRAEYRRLLEA